MCTCLRVFLNRAFSLNQNKTKMLRVPALHSISDGEWKCPSCRYQCTCVSCTTKYALSSSRDTNFYSKKRICTIHETVSRTKNNENSQDQPVINSVLSAVALPLQNNYISLYVSVCACVRVCVGISNAGGTKAETSY